MNIKTYNLLKVEIAKYNNKKTIQAVAGVFLANGLSKSIATRVFSNQDNLEKLSLEELILFSEALYGATRAPSIKLTKLFSEQEIQQYHQQKGSDYVEYIPKNLDSLETRELTKLEFLNTKYGNRQMKQHSWYIYLAHIKGEEDMLEKDLYEFEKMEIIDLMQGVIGSISTKNNTLSFIRHYLDYCVEQGYTTDNLVRYIDTGELITVNKGQIANDYVDTKELNDELAWLEGDESNDISPLDVMIVMLLRSGIAVKEMIKLRNRDFDFEKNTVTYKLLKGTIRKVKLDQEVLNWVERARDMDGKIPRTRFVLQTLDDHIIKLSSNEYSEEQALFSIRRRLAKFKLIGFRALNENILITSKKIDMLDTIANQKGELTTDDFKKVQEYFGNSASSYYKLKTEYQATRGDEVLSYKYDIIGKRL